MKYAVVSKETAIKILVEFPDTAETFDMDAWNTLLYRPITMTIYVDRLVSRDSVRECDISWSVVARRILKDGKPGFLTTSFTPYQMTKESRDLFDQLAKEVWENSGEIKVV